MSMDRYLLFKINKWNKVYFTQNVVKIAGFILVLVIYLINSNVLFTFGSQNELNGTVITQCFSIKSNDWISIWSNVNKYKNYCLNYLIYLKIFI
jgi:hypothetical protein